MHEHTWQHKAVYLKAGLSSGDKAAEKYTEQLTRLGMNGWELIAINGANIAFFKKPR